MSPDEIRQLGVTAVARPRRWRSCSDSWQLPWMILRGALDTAKGLTETVGAYVRT
jgi:hypothetical protein